MPGWRTISGGGGGYIAAAGGQGGVRHIQSGVEPQMITTETWTQEQYDEFQEESRRAAEAHPDHSSGYLSVGGQPLIPVPRGGWLQRLSRSFALPAAQPHSARDPARRGGLAGLLGPGK
jgi:hypothetical protein